MLDMRKIVLENPILAIMRNIPLEIVEDYTAAIVDGGLRFFEVALNSKDALKEISLLREKFGQAAYVGAGTAVTADLAKAAVEAGAQFLVSPSTDIDVLEYCRDYKIPFMPGALTPTDVSACLRYGFDTIKLFPAGDMPKGYVKSLKGPFDRAEFVAIGGVKPENMADFFAQGYIGVGIGGNLLPKDAVKDRNWQACSNYAADMLEQIAKFRK